MAKRSYSRPRGAKLTRRRRPPFSGRLVVVGGQCRKVGKTALMVDLIKAFPEYRWTAIKITPYVESGCPVKGPNCNCELAEHTYAIHNEKVRKGRGDTARFLSAGAEKAIWVQTKRGRLKDALAPLAAAIGKGENVIIESNAILRHWQSDLFLLVLDPQNAEFKESAIGALRLADSFVMRLPYRRGSRPSGRPIPYSGRRKFLQRLGTAIPRNFREFIRQRLLLLDHHKAGQTGTIFS
jgi:hypothetical protein